MVQSRAPSLYVVFTVFIVVDVVATSLRLLARKLARLNLWWDDYFLFIATALQTAGYGTHLNGQSDAKILINASLTHRSNCARWRKARL